MMKSSLVALLVGLVFTSTSAFSAAEKFKGDSPSKQVTFGGLAGLGVLSGSGGFALLGTAAKKIVHRGFIPDINNQVFIEGQLGPVFVSNDVAAFYSVHIRWDFIMDDELTLFALGGLGGHLAGGRDDKDWILHPRLGIGGVWKMSNTVGLRGEISHELTALGVTFGF